MGGGAPVERDRSRSVSRVGGGTHLRVVLFGGFEVWHADRLVRGFESQKVRALFAYLVLNRGRALARDHLAALLWSERDDEVARRNLRQALYNLRETVPQAGPAEPLLAFDASAVRCNPAADVWVDVEAFTAALRPPADGRGAIATHQLTAAANLYRGDLLAGLALRDCPEFDEWLAAEQERLRDVAVGALRALVQALGTRGELRLAIQYARRLVAMDPLSEHAHRDLMRLYALTGQRNRALSHYHDLRALLARELGVEPLAETTDLFQRLLGESVLQAAQAERGAPLRPVVPLVGRDEAIDLLGASWVAALEGEPRVTVVEGDEGVGKTRLVRSFLDMATTHRPAVVVTGRCCDRFPQEPYAPFVQMLRQLFAGGPDGGRQPPRLSRTTRRSLGRLLPELAGAPPPAPAGSAALAREIEKLFSAVAAAFAAVAGAHAAAPTATPLVLFVDDLQWADPGSLALFDHLAGRPVAAPIWLLAVTRTAALPRRRPGAARDGGPARSGGARPQRIRLERLTGRDLEEIARALVPGAQVPDLVAALQATGGLPLAVVALVNTLWDDGALAGAEGGEGWHLKAGPAELQRVTATSLDDLIRARVRRLPTSVRRLASLAAIAGTTFDIDLLCRAEDEHPAVVEVGIEILLERWLVRSAGQLWNPGGLESGLAPWGRGLRAGPFEFDHDRIRRVIAGDVNPIRAQLLHAQVARALAALRPGESQPPEELAFHALAANDAATALAHLRAALDVAVARCAPGNAAACGERAMAIAERLLAAATGEAERKRWRTARASIAAVLASLSPAGRRAAAFPRRR